MTDYNAPETALLDLDWLIDQASLFISANAIANEWEGRLQEFEHKVSGCPGSAGTDRSDRGFGLTGPSPTAMDESIRQEIRLFLAHESVEELYDPFLDRMGRLELTCRKEEVSRRLNRLFTTVRPMIARKAA